MEFLGEGNRWRTTEEREREWREINGSVSALQKQIRFVANFRCTRSSRSIKEGGITWLSFTRRARAHTNSDQEWNFSQKLYLDLWACSTFIRILKHAITAGEREKKLSKMRISIVNCRALSLQKQKFENFSL